MNRSRFLSLLKGSRFEGLLYERAGAPIAATTGQWLVVLAPFAEAEAAMRDAVAPGGLPPTLSVAKILGEARLAPRHYTVEIGPGTEPDPELLALGRERIAQAVAQAQGRVAKADAALALAIERKCGVTWAREKLAFAKAELREIKPGGYHHAVRLGDAYFDLRIVRAALRAMGSTRGTLAGTGDPLKQAVIETDGKSVGLVMPFRR